MKRKLFLETGGLKIKVTVIISLKKEKSSMPAHRFLEHVYAYSGAPYEKQK